MLDLEVDGDAHVVEPQRPFAFAGDATAVASVPEGPVRVLNVVVDPAVVRPYVTVLELGRSSTLPLAADQAAYVVSGARDGLETGSLVLGSRRGGRPVHGRGRHPRARLTRPPPSECLVRPDAPRRRSGELMRRRFTRVVRRRPRVRRAATCRARTDRVRRGTARCGSCSTAPRPGRARATSSRSVTEASGPTSTAGAHTPSECRAAPQPSAVACRSAASASLTDHS